MKHKQLLEHLGHDLEIAWYGPKSEPADVTIECMTCHEVLISCESDFGMDEEDEEETDS